MNKSPVRRWAVLLSMLGLITSQASFAQCENPVGLDDVMAGLDIGFSVDPGDPQPDIMLAAKGIPTRGFIDPEAGDIGTIQCESDHFLTYLWIGAGDGGAEIPSAVNRLQRLENFRTRFSQLNLFIDGLPVTAEVIETEPRDGFNPNTGGPMAYLFVGWITEPYSLTPGFHDVTLEFLLDTDLISYPPVSFEVLDVPKLVAADGSNNNFFGWSSAISGDTAVIGAYKQRNENGRSGAAYVFDRNTAGAVCPATGTQDPWCEQAKLVASDGADGDRFGYRVAISRDTIIVSARRDDTAGGQDAGSAYVFTRSAGVWTQQAKLIASDGAAFDTFGGALAFAGDTALIGAPGDDNGEGSVYVFTGSGTAWTQIQKLTPDDPQANQYFGGGISIFGDTALFGASGDNEMANSAGAAYVFTRSAGDWTQQDKLTASDSVELDSIGVNVALSAHTALLGAPYANKAYVFVRDGVTWEEQAKLTASDGAAGDFFGSVALFGNTAVIGADADSDWAFHSGSAYVFTRSGGVWTERGKFGAPDASEREWFGKDIALSGDIALITAPTSAIDWKHTPGSAYTFDDMDGDSWSHDSDNAPGFYNLDQSDVDGDGIGDVADTDFDGDLDGIAYGVDTEWWTFSAGFSDGTTWGTITNRGGQILSITDEFSPDGVRITAASGGSGAAATISVCGGTAILTFSALDDALITCGSVSISVLIGPLEALIELDGVEATVSVPADNAVTFEPETATLTVTTTPNLPNPPPPVILNIGGAKIPLAPGEITRLNVDIDIKPGSDPNCFNINGHGVIPVAIFGSDIFDVSNIDQGSLSFGGLAVRVKSNAGPQCGFEDANGDGFSDLVCHFEDDASNWTANNGTATIGARLLDGTVISGADSICVVP